jgi:hypothetical protein
VKALSGIVLTGLVAAGLAPLPAPAADDVVRDASDVQLASATPQPAAEAPRRDGARDRVDLDTTVVTGNRELPKVMYIVPWKKADIGELPGQPFNTLLDEVLDPLDRDEFRREVRYFEAISQPRAAAPETP